MNSQQLKEALRKARIQNLKETGKRYLSKSEMAQVFEGVRRFENLMEKKAVKINKVFKIGDILSGGR